MTRTITQARSSSLSSRLKAWGITLAFAFGASAGGCQTSNALLALTGPDDSETDGATETDGSTGDSESATGSTDDTSSSEGGSGTTDDDTDGTDTETMTGGDLLPPQIHELVLTPEQLFFSGPILATVFADEHTSGVRLEYGAELSQGLTFIELEKIEPGVFEGELQICTGFDTGEQTAKATPWLGYDAGEGEGEGEGEDQILEGDTVEATYELLLPEPGGEGYWETGDNGTGPGQVRSMDVLPSGSIVEFMTLAGNGISRCNVRRRTPTGIWGFDDLIDVFPDQECQAIDIKIGDDGTLYLLVNLQINGEWLWKLVKIPTWGAEPLSINLGNKGEAAFALAERDGTLAVCGSAPTAAMEDLTDVMVKIFRPDNPGLPKTFDYVPNEDVSHKFDERAAGCDFFDKETVVVVGEVYGKHSDGDNIKRNRRFHLFYDLIEKKGELQVAEGGLVTQSFATDVQVDPQENRAMLVGYICNDVCEPEGYLWMLDAEGKQTWETSMGLHAIQAFAPHTVRWSPAGYVVVASGGTKGDDAAFLIRAYAPGDSEPLWTYSRTDPNLLNLARTLTIGLFGQVYCGGFGANGFPAFAIVFG